MARLRDSTALVTGASRGIGRGIAEALASEGATVGINHLPVAEEREAGAEVVAAIESDGGTAIALPGNVSDVGSVRSMIEAFEDRLGTPDVLVNNAGILRQSRLEDMPVEQWDEVMSVDLRGVFLTTRFVIPGMLERGSGKVVNVASQLGFKGAEELTHYCAAKGGVIAFTRALAR
jgi:3-oxoacyl-[acyl-carrier protein] reductase